MNESILHIRQWIFNELAKVSIAHARLWNEKFTDDIESMTDEAEVLKRINLFWNIHLAKSHKDLLDTRNWLSDDINIKVWQQRFVSKVLNSIILYVKA